MKRKFRWWLASWLCRAACAVLGQKWYVSDSWHGVPGNRASELHQQLWTEFVAFTRLDDPDREDMLSSVDSKLTELAQAACAAWGHIWPKDPPKPCP